MSVLLQQVRSRTTGAAVRCVCREGCALPCVLASCKCKVAAPRLLTARLPPPLLRCTCRHHAQVVDGQYAFVLHTANPLTGQRGEMFGELVAGLGEVLVSGGCCVAGRLSATAAAAPPAEPQRHEHLLVPPRLLLSLPRSLHGSLTWRPP